MRRPAATVIEVDAVAMMTPAPWAGAGEHAVGRRSSLVSSAIE
jgi:hypothetical protein